LKAGAGSLYPESKPETQLRGSQVLNLQEVTSRVGVEKLKGRTALKPASTVAQQNNDHQVFFLFILLCIVLNERKALKSPANGCVD
jgi:hypothetical protein